jgi:hypothetical protein
VLLALCACAIALVGLLAEAGAVRAGREILTRPHSSIRAEPHAALDPGRERRAERRARELLRSCVDEEDWEMYRDLGFLRVWGGCAGERRYAYLIYPHRPIVAYVPASGRLLSEYCVTFPDLERPYGSTRLPPSDDVLAKWMALTADERGLIGAANMHLAGRQLDATAVRCDLDALGRWERGREQRAAGRVLQL